MRNDERQKTAAERFPISPARVARRLGYSDPKAFAKTRLDIACDDVNLLDSQIRNLNERLDQLQYRAKIAREVCRCLADEYRRDNPEPSAEFLPAITPAHANGMAFHSDKDTNYGSY